MIEQYAVVEDKAIDIIVAIIFIIIGINIFIYI